MSDDMCFRNAEFVQKRNHIRCHEFDAGLGIQRLRPTDGAIVRQDKVKMARKIGISGSQLWLSLARPAIMTTGTPAPCSS